MGVHCTIDPITLPRGAGLERLLAAVSRQLAAEGRDRGGAETTGLTTRQHQVLTAALGAEHTQTQLANILGLDKTTMMVTLDELEREGLAERRPLPSDRRARIVAVTAEGRKLLRKADKAFVEANERVLSRLPEDRAARVPAGARAARLPRLRRVARERGRTRPRRPRLSAPHLHRLQRAGLTVAGAPAASIAVARVPGSARGAVGLDRGQLLS